MVLFRLWMLQYIKYSASKKSLHLQVIALLYFSSAAIPANFTSCQ